MENGKIYFQISAAVSECGTPGMILDGGRSYLETTEKFGKYGICVHVTLRVLICIDCKQCIVPGHVPGHMWKQHGIKIEDLDGLTIDIQKYRIIVLPQDVVVPAPGGPPVEGIRIQTGFGCRFAHCGYACPLLDSMRRHIRDTHKGCNTMTKDEMIDSNKEIQTLFSTISRKFFTVNSGLSKVPMCDPFAKLLRDWIPSLPILEIAAPDTQREVDPFHRAMNWREKLEPWLGTRADVQRLRSLASDPKSTDPKMFRVYPACMKYLQGVRLLGSKHGYTARGRLIPE